MNTGTKEIQTQTPNMNGHRHIDNTIVAHLLELLRDACERQEKKRADRKTD
jgi:hypothetical protein